MTPRQVVRAAEGRLLRLASGCGQELAARVPCWTKPPERTLVAAVPGAGDPAGAVAMLDRSAGRLPVPAALVGAAGEDLLAAFPAAHADLIARAEAAAAGEWDILGEHVRLGVRPDWHRDFRSGVRWNPRRHGSLLQVVRWDGSDVKVPWEISRLQHLPAVAVAWRWTGRRAFADLVCTQIDDWLASNPAGFGVNWTCAMDVALRAVSLSWAWELVRDAPGLPVGLAARVWAGLLAHGRFILANLEDRGPAPGNHYVADLLGLCWLGALYPAFGEARRWRDEGVARLERHLRTQVRPDGGDFEASIPYHRLVLEMTGLAAQILAANGVPVPPGLSGALRRMALFTAAVVRPDGSAPQIGDNDGGRAFRLLSRAPNDHRYLVSWVALVLGDCALAGAAPLDPEAVLLCGGGASARHAALRAAAPQPDPEETISFPDSGIHVLRRGPLHLVASAAPTGRGGWGGHGHNDKLAIDLWWDGPVVADPGTYAYTGAPEERNRFRSTAFHATVRVDGAEQNPPPPREMFALPERSRATSEGWGDGDGGMQWRGSHTGFAPVVHRRTVRVGAADGSIRVADELDEPSGGPSHDILVTFPLAPGVRAGVEGCAALVETPGGTRLRVEFEGPPGLAVCVEDGWHSQTYGAREPCLFLRARVRARCPVRIETRWRRAGAAPRSGRVANGDATVGRRA